MMRHAIHFHYKGAENAASRARGEREPLKSKVREARNLLLPLRQEIISLLQELVRTNSVAIPPEGNETPAQKVLYQFLKQYKLDVETYGVDFLKNSRHRGIRHERHYAGRKNLIARVPGSGRGRSLLLTGHMDTVPAGLNPWKDSPWSGKITRGRLYGRGSFDMKGGLAANFAVAVALKRAGVRLGGDLLCESVVDEEYGGGGGTLAGRLRGDNADACAIPEPTNLTIYRASRGGYVFDLTVRAGESSAYFSKEEVVSPSVPMGRLLGWVDSWAKRRRKIRRGEGAYRKFPDPAPVQVLAVEASNFDPQTPLSVPLMARTRIYLQFLPHENVAGVIREVKNSLAEFCAQDPFFRVHPPVWRPLFDPPLLGHELEANHPWTQCMARSAASVLGRTVQVTAAEYPCDGFILHREFGIPTLLFGPSGAGAHNADEYADVNSVIHTAEVLLAATLDWCGG
jgi:acetylornithine deacetylase